MNVIKKSSAGYQSFDLDAMMLDMRRIFINGEITTASMEETIKQLLFLEHEDAHEPVTIVIDSPGGDICAGMKLVDQIRGMPDTPITVIASGTCASMGALILACGRAGSRFILPHSKVLIHEPYVASAIGGNAASIQRTVESIAQMRQMTIELFSEACGKTHEEIEKAISYDHLFSAQEAVDFGLCDGIIDRI